jgi:hypothetical protein
VCLIVWQWHGSDTHDFIQSLLFSQSITIVYVFLSCLVFLSVSKYVGSHDILYKIFMYFLQFGVWSYYATWKSRSHIVKWMSSIWMLLHVYMLTFKLHLEFEFTLFIYPQFISWKKPEKYIYYWLFLKKYIID